MYHNYLQLRLGDICAKIQRTCCISEVLYIYIYRQRQLQTRDAHALQKYTIPTEYRCRRAMRYARCLRDMQWQGEKRRDTNFQCKKDPLLEHERRLSKFKIYPMQNKASVPLGFLLYKSLKNTSLDGNKAHVKKKKKKDKLIIQKQFNCHKGISSVSNGISRTVKRESLTVVWKILLLTLS